MPKTILFIEDEPILQKTIGSILQKEGIVVKSALDGELGIQKAKEILPDLILLDLILPRKDGFEVLEELKKEEKTKAIPIIVLTNLESAKDIERAIGLGAVSYLVKANYELDEVISKIKEHLK